MPRDSLGAHKGKGQHRSGAPSRLKAKAAQAVAFGISCIVTSVILGRITDSADWPRLQFGMLVDASAGDQYLNGGRVCTVASVHHHPHGRIKVVASANGRAVPLEHWMQDDDRLVLAEAGSIPQGPTEGAPRDESRCADGHQRHHPDCQ